MKKFTGNKIETSHYAENDKVRNIIYELLENLSPEIDGVDNSKLSISGKEDLVEELIKIVENSNIETEIEIYNKILNKNVSNEKVEAKDPLMEAFNNVISDNDNTENV